MAEEISKEKPVETLEKVKPKKAAKKTEKPAAPDKKVMKRVLTKDEWEILSHPLMTEKSIGLVEKENRLVFIVDMKSNKGDVKQAVEKAFDVRVDKVTMAITRKGQKKAFVRLAKDFSASEIATRLGML